MNPRPHQSLFPRLTPRAGVRLAFLLAAAALLAPAPPAHAADPVRFNRDIRPILGSRCLKCHGRDEAARQSGLRLDVRDQATAPADSGAIAIVPGDPEKSELVRRIFADADEAMPPADSGYTLSPAEKEILKRWIAEGAVYEKHWAFIPPEHPVPPAVQNAAWPRNPIDNFILARLEREGLAPSPAADHSTLFRRLSLDLTGLPPALEDLEAFEREMAAAESADRQQGGTAAADHVYESWVNRLLATPDFGERMAVDWMDAARYADTNGYQVDRDREAYAWRDWVIAAFNANMPFDQFTIEQLAGDLLPNSTLDQKIATGFHRNHMLNEEGGIIPEEFLTEYCADRVETTATVWLGQTLLCARCHDHKFDPFTQRDFYSLFAFFHNVPESGVGNFGASIRRNAPPMLKLPAPELEAKIAELKKQRDAAQQQLAAVTDQSNPEHKRLSDLVAELTKKIDETDLQIPTALVLAELPEPRPTFILKRGAYDSPGEQVTADTPQTLPPMPADWPRNRLGLARWLVDPGNPLTARVTVNRAWQSLFGTGIVRTSDDFGTQGEPPSHPELLDWLATEFVRTGWDVKSLWRLIVTSSTYRQTSKATPALRERDPDNRLLARGPRFRLPAEMIRDQALAASGLLVRRLGGPSVKPYHPPGLYEQIVATTGTATYVPSTGDDLYRRSLYTYWKRSLPHPSMQVFDAPFRETCTVRRPRTNTPLQALNLMNDPTYVEAARFIGERMVREGGSTPDERIAFACRLLLSRAPHSEELSILVDAWSQARDDFQADPEAAAAMLSVGATPRDPKIEPAELAAFTTVAMTLMNLDEAITKE